MGSKDNRNNKQKKEKTDFPNVREEFGSEFSGDVNAAKFFDVLLSGEDKKKNK